VWERQAANLANTSRTMLHGRFSKLAVTLLVVIQLDNIVRINIQSMHSKSLSSPLKP